MSELLPNLDALRASLPISGPAALDARELTEAVATAGSPDEITAAIEAVVGRWLSR